MIPACCAPVFEYPCTRTYLLTCERLIREVRQSGRSTVEVAAAEAFLKETLRPIQIEHKESARLSAAEYDEFRRHLAHHITALGR